MGYKPVEQSLRLAASPSRTELRMWRDDTIVFIDFVGIDGRPVKEAAWWAQRSQLFHELFLVATPPGESVSCDDLDLVARRHLRDVRMTQPGNSMGFDREAPSPKHDAYIRLHVPMVADLHLMRYGASLGSVRINPETRSVAFTLDRDTLTKASGTLEFVVVDRQTGTAIQTVNVKAFGTVVNDKRPEYKATADAGGHVRLTDLAPGSWLITVIAAGYGTHVQRVVVEGGRTTRMSPVEMEQGRTLRGVTVDPGGSACACDIECVSADYLGTSSAVLGRTESGRDGKFDLENLPTTPFVVRASRKAPSLAYAAQRIERGTECREVQLTLDSAIEVEIDSSSLTSAARVEVADEKTGNVVANYVVSPNLKSGRRGHVYLCPGEYLVQVRVLDGSIRTQRISVQAGMSAVRL
ncbi:MAG: carboxypeptidase regulatory-like domain-containing protein [Planctomycetes bacterium]|nr:carboxypeptidase regulatory-like domain-containing protein [Planctomycetota bacterium]